MIVPAGLVAGGAIRGRRVFDCWFLGRAVVWAIFIFFDLIWVGASLVLDHPRATMGVE